MPEDTVRFLREEVKRLTEENHDLRESLQALNESVRAIALLYHELRKINAETDILKLLGHILDVSLAVLKATDGSLLLQDEATGELVFAVVRGKVTDRLTGYRLPKGAGIAGWVVEHCEPQVILDVRHDTRFYPQVDEASGITTRSMVCVPVLLDNGRVLGVVEILNKISDREFTSAPWYQLQLRLRRHRISHLWHFVISSRAGIFLLCTGRASLVITFWL